MLPTGAEFAGSATGLISVGSASEAGSDICQKIFQEKTQVRLNFKHYQVKKAKNKRLYEHYFVGFFDRVCTILRHRFKILNLGSKKGPDLVLLYQCYHDVIWFKTNKTCLNFDKNFKTIEREIPGLLCPCVRR